MAINFGMMNRQRLEGGSPMTQGIHIRSQAEIQQEATQSYMNNLYNKFYDIGEFSIENNAPKYSKGQFTPGDSSMSQEWNQYKQVAGNTADYKQFAQLYKNLEDERGGLIDEKLAKIEQMGYSRPAIEAFMKSNPDMYREILRQAARNPESLSAGYVIPNRGWIARGLNQAGQSELPTMAGLAVGGRALMEGVKQGSLSGAGAGAWKGVKGLVPLSGLNWEKGGKFMDDELVKNLGLKDAKTATAKSKRFQDKINKFKAEDLTKSRSARDAAKAAVLKVEGRKGKVVDKLKASIKALDKKSPTYAADRAALEAKILSQPTAVSKAQKSIDNYKKKLAKLEGPGSGRSKGKGSINKKKAAVAKVNKKIAEHQSIIDKISGTSGKKGKEGTLKKAIAALEEKTGAHDKSYKQFQSLTGEAGKQKQKSAMKTLAKLKKRYGAPKLVGAVAKKVGWKKAVSLLGKGAIGALLTGSGIGTAAGLAMDAYTIYEVVNILRAMTPDDFEGITPTSITAPAGKL